jgi:hypothetical protein
VGRPEPPQCESRRHVPAPARLTSRHRPMKARHDAIERAVPNGSGAETLIDWAAR